MPLFMDRHDLTGMTMEDVARAHSMDVEIQDDFGVRILTYWFDLARSTGFYLIDAPDRETALRVHEESHGNVAADIIRIDLSAVEAVMFTDLVDSTGMTARLGDVRSVEMVRAHDSLVRRALGDVGGREIKHTGDGIMASFDDVDATVRSTCAMQRSFEIFNSNSDEELHVRIGIHAGEPVQDNNDLFGVTVQMAARICDHAAADAIVVSDAVREDLQDPVSFSALGAVSLKGFARPVALYEIDWR